MVRIEAVFFDLYETLITEFDPDWRPLPTPAERLGIGAKAFDAEWRAWRNARMTDACLDYPDVLRRICAACNHDVDEDVIKQLRTERIANKAAPFERVEDSVLRMLHAIGQAGVKLGVISNCASEEVAAWETSPLAELFDDNVFSCQVGYVKPDIEIYRLACERLDVVAERSIFVGDGGSHELEGAARAGLIPFQATWFLDRWPAWRRTASTYKAAAHHPTLHSPSELVGVLATQSHSEPHATQKDSYSN